MALAVIIAGTGWLFQSTPTGFLPSEDQGAIFGEIVLPEGASVNRTDAVAQRVEETVRATDGVAGVMSVVGYSLLDGQVKSNAALLVMTLKPFKTEPIRPSPRTRSSPGSATSSGRSEKPP